MSDPKASKRYVYFMRPIGGDGRVKIGCSFLPVSRLVALSVYSPYQLEVIGVAKGSFNTERMLHEYFHADLLHREWFRSSPELIRVIVLMGRGMSAADALASLTQMVAA